MIQNKSGQNIIEYVLLISLVIGGVLVVGPYVIRSWNANVKGFDDGVRDSLQEPLQSGPSQPIVAPCICAWEDPPLCPNNQNPTACQNGLYCGVGSCGEVEDSLVWTCSPLGCDAPPTAAAVNPPNDPPNDPHNQYNLCQGAGKNLSGNNCCEEVAGCCSVPKKETVPDECNAQGCDPEYVPALYYCGGEDSNNPTRVDCQFDLGCAFQCQAMPDPAVITTTIDSTLGVPCIDDFIGLSDNLTNLSFVEAGGCSDGDLGTAPKCQWQCAPTFLADGGVCDCPIKKGYELIPGAGERMVGYGCDGDDCSNCGCPSNWDTFLGKKYCRPKVGWGSWEFFAPNGTVGVCSDVFTCQVNGMTVTIGEDKFGPLCEVGGLPVYWSMGESGSADTCIYPNCPNLVTDCRTDTIDLPYVYQYDQNIGSGAGTKGPWKISSEPSVGLTMDQQYFSGVAGLDVALPHTGSLRSHTAQSKSGATL